MDTVGFHITHHSAVPFINDLHNSYDMILYFLVLYWFLELDDTTFVICE